MVSVACPNGDQCFGGFSGGIARKRTNFGRSPEVFSRWPDCSKMYFIENLNQVTNSTPQKFKKFINVDNQISRIIQL